jgi:hypothetical protein
MVSSLPCLNIVYVKAFSQERQIREAITRSKVNYGNSDEKYTSGKEIEALSTSSLPSIASLHRIIASSLHLIT